MIGWLILGLALGAGLGWWLGRAQRTVAPPDDLPSGPRVKGVDPEGLWALERGQWVRMKQTGEVWHPDERLGPSERPFPLEFPPVVGWGVGVARDPDVRQALEGWTEAVVAASQVGWVTGIPAGDQLVEGWARTAEPTEDPARAFARWLVGELGRAARNGLEDRGIADQRGVVARRLHQAAGRLLLALDDRLELTLEPPGGVGPRQREQWLVDAELATALGNPPVAQVVQPLVVLRPLLRCGDAVVLEGEVA